MFIYINLLSYKSVLIRPCILILPAYVYNATNCKFTYELTCTHISYINLVKIKRQ